jgi:FKBP-type peptidyl-prolyl cis-trans isomerase FkpA/FKBP-type peptidyl-prolyl cis-trans isomerase FklB
MPKSSILVVAALAMCLSCVKAEPPKPAEPELANDDQKTLYALGLVISSNLGVFNLSDSELEIVKAGLSDGVMKKTPKVEVDTYGPKIQTLAQSRMGAAAATEKKASEEFLQKAAAEPGATKTTSGMIYSVMTPGTGESPKPTDTVTVHYKGTLTDGTVFDSSVERGQPATFSLAQVVPCWTEALQLMKVGGKNKVVCPSEIAYGDQGRPPKIKPGAALVFEVELLEVKH